MTKLPKRDPAHAYASALESAWEAYGRAVPAAAASNAAAAHDALSGAVTVRLLGADFRVEAGSRSVVRPGGGPEAGAAEKILLLHYLTCANGRPPAGRDVAFREIPGCAFYSATFHAHTVLELVRAFGNDEALFERACAALEGVREAGSGVRMRIPALPRVPVTLCYWAGDEEMPAGAQVLFDAGVGDYLPAEDIAVLGETVAHRVAHAAGRGGASCMGEAG